MPGSQQSVHWIKGPDPELGLIQCCDIHSCSATFVDLFQSYPVIFPEMYSHYNDVSLSRPSDSHVWRHVDGYWTSNC